MSASFDSYKIFYYVAKYGNITRAASTLFLSQSTVSRSVQSLEAELGCRLFTRFQHGVELTVEGEILFRHVSTGCEALLRGEEHLKQTVAAQGNELRIGASDFLCRRILIPALSAFAPLFPDITVSVSTHWDYNGDDITAALDDGLLHILFALSPLPASESLLTKSIGETKDFIVAGRAFAPRLAGRAVSLTELQSYPFVDRVIPGGSSYLAQAFQRHGLVIQPRYRVDTAANFLPLVSEGLCLALVPEPVLRAIPESDGIFALELAEALPPRQACAFTSRVSPVGIAGDELIRCFRRTFTEQISGAAGA